MGGNAFASLLPGSVFPRMSPARYYALKTGLHEKLASFFAHVGTPREAPGKLDYGDLDFIVSQPLVALDSNRQLLRNALGAAHVIAGRTDNFAIALPPEREEDSSLDQVFVQVDVNKCPTVDEWKRVMFFHAYGDTGMILGLIARSYSLSVGSNGLKIVVDQPGENEIPSLFLSADFDAIMKFYALDMVPWEAGFGTQRAVFEWISTSRLFHPSCHRESARRAHQRIGRAMYHDFLKWVLELDAGNEWTNVQPLTRAEVVEQAKDFFGKREEYNALVHAKQKSARLKLVFSGRLVMEWTGLQGKPVSQVMDIVRAEVSEDQMMKLTVDDMKELVLKAHAQHTAALALAAATPQPAPEAAESVMSTPAT